MNFGIYIENVGEHQVAAPAFEAANAAFDSKDFLSACLFYQNIGKKPEKNKFGMFNSSDVGFFTGDLVVTFLDGVKSAIKEINNRTVYYYYGLENTKDLFGLLSICNNPSVKIVVGNTKDFDYIKRATGKNPVAISELQTLPEVISNIRDKK